MTGIEDRIGGTTAGMGGMTAGFVRGKAVLAALALALAMLAAVTLLPKEASAHGTGYVGDHSHGQLYCGNGGQIHLFGDGGFYRFRASAYNVNGRFQSDDVRYRAHAYRWNGSTWVYVTSTRWFQRTVSYPYSTDLGFPRIGDPAFLVSSGYWKVSTEIHWYDGYHDGGEYLGSSPNAWAQGMCTYR